MATDNFNRANESPVLLAPWRMGSTQADSAWQLFSNQAIPAVASFVAWTYYDSTWTGDHYSQGTIGGPAIGSLFIGVGVRMQSTGERGYVLWDSAGTYKLERDDAGTFTTLISTIANSPSGGDVLKLQAVGSTLTAWVNGSIVGTVTDTTYSTGAPGMVGYGNSAQVTLDDWEGVDVGAGGGGGSGAAFRRGSMPLFGVS